MVLVSIMSTCLGLLLASDVSNLCCYFSWSFPFAVVSGTRNDDCTNYWSVSFFYNTFDRNCLRVPDCYLIPWRSILSVRKPTHVFLKYWTKVETPLKLYVWWLRGVLNCNFPSSFYGSLVDRAYAYNECTEIETNIENHY